MSFKRILLVKSKGKKGLGFSADVIPLGLEYVEPRTIQITLKHNGQLANYIIKITGKGVDYIKGTSRKQDDVDIDADLDELMDSFNDFSSFNPMNYISLLKQAWDINGILNIVRLGTALTTDLGDSYLEDKLMVIK
jgi:hypothetical protein